MFQEHTSFFLYVQASVANLGSVVKIIIITYLTYFNRMTISVIKTAINIGSVG